jgi:DNA-binding response OmpR family regulator
MKVLIVEDEEKVASFIKKGLEEENFNVDVAYSGDVGENLILSNNYDIIILDIMLPVKDGNEILKKMRDKGIDTPVIMLTAKDKISDKVESFSIGCDDYLTKPFSFEELLLRVRAILKRKGGKEEKETTMLSYGDLKLDLIKRIAIRDNKEIELTSKEFALLELLMRNPNKIISRTEISQKVWGYDFDTLTNIIDVYINHLRNKMDKGFDKRLIHTIRGVGYIFTDEKRS